jgi:hypothetical protein
MMVFDAVFADERPKSRAAAEVERWFLAAGYNDRGNSHASLRPLLTRGPADKPLTTSH